MDDLRWHLCSQIVLAGPNKTLIGVQPAKYTASSGFCRCGCMFLPFNFQAPSDSQHFPGYSLLWEALCVTPTLVPFFGCMQPATVSKGVLPQVLIRAMCVSCRDVHSLTGEGQVRYTRNAASSGQQDQQSISDLVCHINLKPSWESGQSLPGFKPAGHDVSGFTRD